MLLKTSRFFLFASVFCVVVVMASTFFPFIGGKYYFFRVAVEASLAFLLLWWGFEAPEGELEKRLGNISKTWIFRAVSVFIFVFLLAALFADDPRAAFWSNYERGEGAFQMLHYYAFFVLLSVLLTSRKDWMKFFKISVVAAILMILYGIGAAMFITNTDAQGTVSYSTPFKLIGPYRDTNGVPIAPTLFKRIFSPARFQGSLGNPAYVAPYLIFSIFYVCWLWFARRVKANKWEIAGYIALICTFLIFFTLSGTRGGFLGLAVAVPLFFIYVAFSSPRFRRPAAIGLIALMLLSGAVYAFRKPLIEHNAIGSRFLTISFTEQTAQTRFWTWNSAFNGFKDRPILGWGPENFSTVFDRYFDTRHYVPGKTTETWFDRAHSVVFDYLAETGLLGFLSYIGMFAAFYYGFFSRRKIASDASAPEKRIIPDDGGFLGLNDSAILRGLMLVVLAAYFVQGLILFDVLPIYINLFIVLAFALFEFEKRNEYGY